MANIITTSFFFSQFKIAQSSEPSVAAALNELIDVLEPEFLEKLMGYELFTAYTTGIAQSPTPEQRMVDIRDGKEFLDRYGVKQKWKGLKFTNGSGKSSPIANYIYYWDLRNKATSTTGTGEKKLDAKNATSTDSIHKQCRAWNKMVDWNLAFWEFMYAEQGTYPEYFNDIRMYSRKGDVYNRINYLNL